MSHDDRLPDSARVVLKRRFTHADRSAGGAAPWPADVRALLASGGLQDAGR